MSKHTPGPWHWEDSYDFEPHKGNRDWQSENLREGRIKLVSACGKTILEEWSAYADDAGLTVKRDDALVIAAAPDLLEALKRTEELLSSVDGMSPNNIRNIAAELLDEHVLPAIAKAEGR